MSRFAKFIPGLSILISSFLLACAPTRDPLGLSLLRGRVPDFLPPDSLRADLEIVPRAPPGAPSVSARLYARPHRSYRLEIFGLIGVAASYLWENGRWVLLLHQRREVVFGDGDSLELEGQALRLPDVQALLGFIWGEPLPGLWRREGDVALSGDTLRWNFHGEKWWARFDAHGACQEAVSPSLRLGYEKPRRFGARVIPDAVEAWTDGHPVLRLRLRGVEDNPAWKKDPFALPVPPDYVRHRAGESR